MDISTNQYAYFKIKNTTYWLDLYSNALFIETASLQLVSMYVCKWDNNRGIPFLTSYSHPILLLSLLPSHRDPTHHSAAEPCHCLPLWNPASTLPMHSSGWPRPTNHLDSQRTCHHIANHVPYKYVHTRNRQWWTWLYCHGNPSDFSTDGGELWKCDMHCRNYP